MWEMPTYRLSMPQVDDPTLECMSLILIGLSGSYFKKKLVKEQKEKSRHGGTSLKYGYLVGGGSGVQSHLLVQSGFKASMGYSRHCLKQKQHGRHIHKSYLPLNSLQNINIKYSYSTMVRIMKSRLYSCCIYLLVLGCSPSQRRFLYHSDLEDH